MYLQECRLGQIAVGGGQYPGPVLLHGWYIALDEFMNEAGLR